jgi:hypothetical protein
LTLQYQHTPDLHHSQTLSIWKKKIAEQERMQKRTFTTLHIFSPAIIDDSLGRTSTSQIETLSEY